jgi:hypothetical protein
VKRQGNNPKRRIAAVTSLDEKQRKSLASTASYAGSGHHKRSPADYGLERTNPRPTKSLCDFAKVVSLKEARKLLTKGIELGMVSDFRYGRFPKFVWSVGAEDEVYEAKTSANSSGAYHGYPLEAEDDFRKHVLSEWKKRCR